MTKGAVRAFAFALFLMILGATLAVPRPGLRGFAASPTREAWIRVVGALVPCLASGDTLTARAGAGATVAARVEEERGAWLDVPRAAAQAPARAGLRSADEFGSMDGYACG